MSFKDLVGQFTGLISITVPVVLALAMLVFFWGLVTFLVKSGDEEALRKGKQRMFWGILGLFIMFSIWGIVRLIGSIFGLDFNVGG